MLPRELAEFGHGHPRLDFGACGSDAGFGAAIPVHAVRDASGQSRIETLDILVSAQGAARAVGYFIYHWQLKDGSMVHFGCADVFDFDPEGRIARMTIVYDTHPIRAEVGDKYA